MFCVISSTAVFEIETIECLRERESNTIRIRKRLALNDIGRMSSRTTYLPRYERNGNSKVSCWPSGKHKMLHIFWNALA